MDDYETTPEIIFIDGVAGYETSFLIDLNGEDGLQIDAYCDLLGEIFYPEIH